MKKVFCLDQKPRSLWEATSQSLFWSKIVKINQVPEVSDIKAKYLGHLEANTFRFILDGAKIMIETSAEYQRKQGWLHYTFPELNRQIMKEIPFWQNSCYVTKISHHFMLNIWQEEFE